MEADVDDDSVGVPPSPPNLRANSPGNGIYPNAHKQSNTLSSHRSSLSEPSASAMHTPETSRTPTRNRLYTAGLKGPFTVTIQELSKKIQPIQFSSYINQTYKSVRMIKRSQGQLKIILDSHLDANAIVANEVFRDYRTAIPADRVEIEGAFNSEDLCDLRDMSTLITNGVGGFRNTSLAAVKIIHAERIYRADPKSLTGKILTNTIKVVFEGQLLPHFITLEGLRIIIRPFHQKPMYCDNCQIFGHTAKYCRRKPLCARCAGEHKTILCQDESSINNICPFASCTDASTHNKNSCPFFKEVIIDYNKTQTLRQKGRYLHAIAAARSSSQPTANHAPACDDVEQFPALTNRFSTLPEILDNVQSPSMPITSTKQSNPYAKALKKALSRTEIRPRSASKRRRIEETSPTINVTSNNETLSQDRPKPTITNNNPTVAALKAAIISFARQAQVAEIWISLIEAIIDPLLSALLPQLPVLLANLGPSVLASHR